MSVGTVSPGSDGASTSSTEIVDSSDYVYNIPDTDLRGICYYIDKDNAWERVACLMGYTEHDNIVSLYCILHTGTYNIVFDSNRFVADSSRLIFYTNKANFT